LKSELPVLRLRGIARTLHAHLGGEHPEAIRFEDRGERWFYALDCPICGDGYEREIKPRVGTRASSRSSRPRSARGLRHAGEPSHGEHEELESRRMTRRNPSSNPPRVPTPRCPSGWPRPAEPNKRTVTKEDSVATVSKLRSPRGPVLRRRETRLGPARGRGRDRRAHRRGPEPGQGHHLGQPEEGGPDGRGGQERGHGRELEVGGPVPCPVKGEIIEVNEAAVSTRVITGSRTAPGGSPRSGLRTGRLIPPDWATGERGSPPTRLPGAGRNQLRLMGDPA